jgi:UDP-N-acetylglucosamine 2-epimerase (non-hydrolysing)
MKISIIFGTRPEAIKLAPIILLLRGRDDVQCRVCITGQHREMLDQVLRVFEITPDADLNLMQPDQSLSSLTSRALEAVNGYLSAERPDLVMVQGDTTTTFVAALAAFYNNIPIAHVEAGLRTGNLHAPWPEEANRVLTSHLAYLHFAATEQSRLNLIREGIVEERIQVTGNTVIDALLLARDKVRADTPIVPGLDAEWVHSQPSTRMVLITGHRRESFGKGFESICRGIADLAANFPDVQFVYPVHLNPNVRRPVLAILRNGKEASASLPNVHLIEPVPYLAFVALMDRATLVLTDSGGVQEEAPSLGKPVLVMRDVTERPEGVIAGTAKLVGTRTSDIVREVSSLLTDESSYASMARAINPYGDGKAAPRIVDVLLREWTETQGPGSRIR